MGSKFKVQKVPGSHHKERNRKKKMVPPRTVAVKGKERNVKKKKIRINNEATRWERNHKEKILKNMEIVKIVERVFK